MEEDINILEDFLEYYGFIKNCSGSDDVRQFEIYVAKNEIKAIENLIARNKELEEGINNAVSNETKLIRENTKLRKENQELSEDFIPKSKIKAKIKEVFDILDTKPYTAYTLYGDKLFDSSDIKEVLQELLEEE